MSTDRPASDRIIVALDVPTLEEAVAVVRATCPYVGGYKIGLRLLTACGGLQVVAAIRSSVIPAAWSRRIMYDAKFHDIPNTMADAAAAVAELGVWGFTVHATAGRAAVVAAVRAAAGRSLVLGVTCLTSLRDADAQSIYNRSRAADCVVEFAGLAHASGVAGLVCAPMEVATLRGFEYMRGLRLVAPNARPAWAPSNDQNAARSMTPGEAVLAGADDLVIGRPILAPPAATGYDRAAAALAIAAEIEEALARREA